MIKTNEIKSVSRKIVAQVFKMDASNVNKWCSRGCPRNKDGSYDLSEVIAWRLDELALSNDGNSESPEAQKWLTAFRRERALLAKIERKKVEGKLIQVDEMFREWAKRLNTLFSGIRLWSDRLSPRLEGKNRDEIGRIFEEETYILQLQFVKKGRYTPEVDGFATPEEPDSVKKD
jgi:phage terminase Nu1 subunit (DNA packaging protein)